MQRLPDLHELLEYKNPHIIKRYQRDFPQNHDRAEDLLRDVLKFLWLCKKHAVEKKYTPDNEPLNFTSMIHEEMRDIDNMWHTFILHTQDYADFCMRYFGDFLHHVPNDPDEPPQKPDDFEQDLTKYLSYIYDNLGEETVRSWFAEYTNR